MSYSGRRELPSRDRTRTRCNIIIVSSSLTASACRAPTPCRKVPPGAVMAATVIVDSGEFKGTSKIQSTGTVGCSYSLFGDNQWRINFSSEGEFASKDTTDSGRHVIAFGVTAKSDGSAELGVTFTNGQQSQDLEDQQRLRQRGRQRLGRDLRIRRTQRRRHALPRRGTVHEAAAQPVRGSRGLRARRGAGRRRAWLCHHG